MKKLIILCLLVASIIGCSNEKKTEQNKTSEIQTENNQVAALQSYEMDIEGMTCEIGCARTIESKLSKVKGVSYSKVDFETKKGVFTIDTNLISEEKVKEKIDGIAGGNLYSVVKSKKINKILK